MTPNFIRPILLAFFALALQAAHAQYSNPYSGRSFSSIHSANTDMMLSRMVQQGQMRANYLAMQQQIQRQQAAGAGKAAPAAAAPAAQQARHKLPITATDFQPAGPRNAPELLASGAANAKDRQQLVDVGRTIQKTIEATPGFRRNNVASAMALLLGVSLQVTYGVEFSDAEGESIVRQFNDALGGMPEFKSLTARQRTEMYDGFVVIAGYIAGIAHEGAQSGHAGLAKQAKEMARDTLDRFGFRI